MDLLLWIIVGGISGWFASIVMKTNSSQGMLMDVVLGIVGAFVGGFIMSLFGSPGVTGFNLWSVLVATLGAIVLIYLGRVFQQASTS